MARAPITSRIWAGGNKAFARQKETPELDALGQCEPLFVMTLFANASANETGQTYQSGAQQR